jgi:transposase
VRIAAPQSGVETPGLASGDAVASGAPVQAAWRGLIEIDLGARRRIRVDCDVDADALARVLDVLERR